MEMTVAKTISKAAQEQHNGSKSATTELIAVDDPDALSYPKCLHLLKPPVFQCTPGHLICSSCHDVLPDKNKCASCFIKTAYTCCFIPTGYRRCHGVERFLQSIHRVACHDVITGGKMLNHEKKEHEKICCPSKAGHAQRQGRVVKMGPCGGGGGDGNGWKMDVRGINRIIKVVIWHGGAVDAIRVLHEQDGARKVWTKKWGGSGGKRSEIHLQPDEYLTCVKGHIGHYNGWFVLRSLRFVSNRCTFGRYGQVEGASFELLASGGRIVGFHGRAGCLIDALGTYVKLDF